MADRSVGTTSPGTNTATASPRGSRGEGCLEEFRAEGRTSRTTPQRGVDSVEDTTRGGEDTDQAATTGRTKDTLHTFGVAPRISRDDSRLPDMITPMITRSNGRLVLQRSKLSACLAPRPLMQSIGIRGQRHLKCHWRMRSCLAPESSMSTT